jgi:hypothetical protein
MKFDVISLSEEETSALTTIQLKLLRTTQQKKDALYHTLQEDLNEYRLLTFTDGVHNSSLYGDKERELIEEYEYQVEILREQLIFNMSLNEPTTDDETGDSGLGEGQTTGYIVDYELSYLERYIQVRDYYMTIEDPDERLALYAADSVALEYLSSYYTTLFNYFRSFT